MKIISFFLSFFSTSVRYMTGLDLPNKDRSLAGGFNKKRLWQILSLPNRIARMQPLEKAAKQSISFIICASSIMTESNIWSLLARESACKENVPLSTI
jgi:hypothetical protein